MSLSNQVQEAIQKELPNMVASELQEYIKQADADKAKLVQAEVKAVNQEIALVNLANKVADLEKLKLSAQLLAEDREKLKEEQRDLKVRTAQIERDAAVGSKNDIYNLVHGLFRNTEFKKNMRDSTPIATTYSNGGQPYSSVQNYDTHKETKEEAV